MPNPKKPRANCLHCASECNNPYAKYCGNKCQQAYRNAQRYARFESVGVADFTENGHKPARKYLIQRDGHVCQTCKRTEWNDKPIPLTLDHADGDHTNWALTNIRMVCPNCDAQSPFFAGRNKGRGGRKHLNRCSKRPVDVVDAEGLQLGSVAQLDSAQDSES